MVKFEKSKISMFSVAATTPFSGNDVSLSHFVAFRFCNRKNPTPSLPFLQRKENRSLALNFPLQLWKQIKCSSSAQQTRSTPLLLWQKNQNDPKPQTLASTFVSKPLAGTERVLLSPSFFAPHCSKGLTNPLLNQTTTTGSLLSELSWAKPLSAFSICSTLNMLEEQMWMRIFGAILH